MTQTSEKAQKFLSQQSELFAHFMSDVMAGTAPPPHVPSEPPAVTPVGTVTPPHRRLRTEKEEDEELLKAGLEDSGAPPLHSQPTWLQGGTMRVYQLEGLNWLVELHRNGLNGILADEMGLGKTMQTISLLGYMKHELGVTKPSLVIVPKSTLSNWKKECERWCPSLRTFKFHATKDTRHGVVQANLTPKSMEYDVVVTTYEMATKEKGALSRISWAYIIIDEAHRIKNEASLLSRIVRLFPSEHRLLITGTPLQNNLHELWALLNFLLPDVFASSDRFDAWFDLASAREDQAEIVSRLHKLLRPFLLRRKKVDVEKDLPPKKEIKLYVPLTEAQRKAYVALLSKDIDTLNGALGTAGQGRMRLLNLVMQLRKCCNHPYLFDGAEPGPPFENGQHIVDAAGKLVLLDKLLPRLQARGSRVLIFSQMTRMLDILDDYMVMRGYQYCRLDGSTLGDDRDDMIDAFNAPDSKKFVFLLSTRAGGLGINLATADTVVLYDSDWNPQMDLQAQDRAHRIGQTKPVMVYRFVTEGTVEEKVVERAEAKLHLDALVIQQGRLADAHKAVSGDELLSMVRFGADAIFQGTGAPVTDEDIDAIIARGEERSEALSNRIKERESSMLDALDLGAGQSVYLFEDVDWRTRQKKEENWISLPSRNRKSAYADRPPPPPPKKSRVRVTHAPDYTFVPKQVRPLLEKEAAAAKARADWENRDDPKSDDEAPDFGELTDAEVARRDDLLKRGFTDWTRKDLLAFVRASEAHGRDAYDAIADDMGSRSAAEARAYAKAFWARHAELKEGARLVQQIERGEEALRRHAHIADLLRNLLARYKNPWRDLPIPRVPSSQPRVYTDEEDRFILCAAGKYGLDAWDRIRAETRRQPQFRFDWFIRSRMPRELKARFDHLIKIIEKE